MRSSLTGILLSLLLASATYAQEPEEVPPEVPPPAKLELYRILSGENYAINLRDDKEFLYFIPINYKVESEAGLGFPGEQDKLQPGEQPDTLRLSHVGMAIVGRANMPNQLYLSLFIKGAIPSQCHKPKVETKTEVNEKGVTIINNLIFSGIPRTKLCPTQNLPIEFTFLGEKIPQNSPIEVQINYQPLAEINWENDNLIVIQRNRIWKITRISRIISQEALNKRWLGEWLNGKELKKEQSKPQPKPPEPNNPPTPPESPPSPETE